MPQAIYAIEFGTSEVYIYFSVHSGEPSKTARLFWNMHHYRWLKLDWAEAFIKANPSEVNFALDFDFRSDDIYRYIIKWNGQVIVYRKHTIAKDRWDILFQGHYAAFIDQYGEDEQFEPLYRLSSEVCYGISYATRSEIEAHLEHLKNYSCSAWIKGEIARWENEYQRICALNDATY